MTFTGRDDLCIFDRQDTTHGVLTTNGNVLTRTVEAQDFKSRTIDDAFEGPRGHLVLIDRTFSIMTD